MTKIIFLVLIAISSTSFAETKTSTTTIKTQGKSMKYTFEKTKTVIQVAPNSEVKVSPDATPESIELISGMVRARVLKNIAAKKDTPPKFLVKTQAATMGVRGTDFIGIATPVLGEAEIVVFEGNVDFTSAADANDVKHIPAGTWGGIGGRFGAKAHDLIALPKAALDHFDSATKF
jgi:ferric-dicitrate binding protein FerR (iron transport regulator)